MTMSVTATERVREEYGGRWQKVSFAFVSAAAGTASGVSSKRYTGEVVRAVFIPGTSGDQPTNAFDVTVTDADGYDILAGQGADISNAATTTVVASLGAVVYDVLTLNVTNAGDTKTGTVIVYVRG